MRQIFWYRSVLCLSEINKLNLHLNWNQNLSFSDILSVDRNAMLNLQHINYVNNVGRNEVVMMLSSPGGPVVHISHRYCYYKL